jgi:hypothetical protein
MTRQITHVLFVPAGRPMVACSGSWHGAAAGGVHRRSHISNHEDTAAAQLALGFHQVVDDWHCMPLAVPQHCWMSVCGIALRLT